MATRIRGHENATAFTHGRVEFAYARRCMGPADQESSYRAIERVIATYAELVDDGDFAAVGGLLSDATFAGSAGLVTGRDAIEKMLRDSVIVSGRYLDRFERRHGLWRFVERRVQTDLVGDLSRQLRRSSTSATIGR